MSEGIFKEICFTLAKSHEDGATKYLRTMIYENQDLISDKEDFYSKIVEMMGYIKFNDKMEITDESISKLYYISSLFIQLKDFSSIMNNWINSNKEEVNTTIIYLANNPVLKNNIENYFMDNYINYINNDEIIKYIFKIDNLDIEKTFEELINEKKWTEEKIETIKDDETIVGYDNGIFHASGYPIYKNVETKEKKNLREKVKILDSRIKELIFLNVERINFDYQILYKILRGFNDYSAWISLVIDNNLIEREKFNKIDFYIKMTEVDSLYLFNKFAISDKSLTLKDLKKIEEEYSKTEKDAYQDRYKYPIYNSLKNEKASNDNNEIKRYIKYVDKKLEKEKQDFIAMRQREDMLLKQISEDRKRGISRFPY